MDFEQIVKRLDFLEKQQRENKETLGTLSARMASFESSVTVVSKQIKTISKQVADITPGTKRVEQFETMVAKQRNEFLKMFEEIEKVRVQTEREWSTKYQPEFLEINKALAQLKTATDLTEIKRQIKQRENEIQRVATNFEDIKTRIDEAKRANEDVEHALRASEEARKNDLKRVADVQGELTSIRKRIDENREKTTLTTDSVRSVENRFKELVASELERKQAQTAFIEQQTIAQMDRDRAWKEWRDKYETFLKESDGLDVHIQKLDEALRGAKKAQETYLELNTKLERRISEVTEMQRLAEDRLRQEWISFKADDQKRWTGYNLSSEESFRDIRKEVQKYDGRITPLNDITQVLQDQMHQTTDATEKQLQELMNVVHEWMTSYQRIMGHGKKTPKK